MIERAKTPTRDDALTARLKLLRNQQDSPSGEAKSSSPRQASAQASTPTRKLNTKASAEKDSQDGMFATDDDTLEELLKDTEEDATHEEPNDEQVKALLEQLSADIPKDTQPDEEENENSVDESDDDKTDEQVDDVIERYRDEAEQDEKDEERAMHDTLALPAVPTNLEDMPTSPPASSDLNDITARLAALKSPTKGQDNDELSFPSVPTSRPSGKPVKRLTSKTAYTDDDVDSWCTVCLEDATLRCLGCDDDVYCTRCWKEMHVLPAAAFDDRTHKAVQFTRDKKERKVAI